MLRIRRVKKGKWRTVESFWNASGTAFFRLPRGARIKVRYGVGWFGKDRQKQTLDGDDFRELSVGGWSVTRARMQVRVSETTEITYDVYPGDVSISFPEVRF